MTPRLRTIALAAAAGLAAGLSPAARALDLLGTWQAARDHDPTFAADRAAREAGATGRDQARALWRPGVSLEAGAAWGGSESAVRGAQFSAPGFGTSDGVSFDTSVTNGSATNVSLAVRQPLYDRALDARGRELRTSADAADIAWTQAQQDLILRSVDAYLDAALAAERLRLLERQQASVDRALAEAEDRFRLGDKPVTDVHEARARSKSLAAQRLAARADAQARRAALLDLTGPLPGEADASLSLPLDRGLVGEAEASGPGASLDDWLSRATRHAPAVRLALAQVDIAEARADGVRGALSPTVDLVAQVGRDRLSGTGDHGSASNTRRDAAVGLRLSVPLYTGGMRSAQSAQAQSRATEARARLDAAQQQVAQQVRTAWLDLSIAHERLAALAASRDASRARLDATRTGLQAGDRTTLDLLNAENDTAGAELALTEARARVLSQRLRLEALAGTLDETALRRANASLSPMPMR